MRSLLYILFIVLVLGASYDGSTPLSASSSCYQILMDYPSSQSGFYYIDNYQSVSPYRTYCDMTTNGGGWTLWYANANYANAEYKLPYSSWLTYDLPFITESMTDIQSPSFVGMNPLYNLQATSVMARQSSWAEGQYAALHFPDTTSFSDFVSMKTVSTSCVSFTNDAEVTVDNSGYDAYTINKFSAMNNVYGYKSCNSASSTDSSSTVELATDNFLGRLSYSTGTPNDYIDACGGSLGANTHCYYFVRETINPVKPTLTSSLTGYNAPFTVTVNFQNKITLETPLSVIDFTVTNDATLSNLVSTGATTYSILVTPSKVGIVTIQLKNGLVYNNKMTTQASNILSINYSNVKNNVVITSNIPNNGLVHTTTITATFTFTYGVDSLTSDSLTKDSSLAFYNFAYTDSTKTIWTASATIIKPGNRCFRIAENSVLASNLYSNFESNTYCFVQPHTTSIPASMTLTYSSSASTFKYIPLYLTFDSLYTIDTSKIAVTGAANPLIESALYYPTMSTSYIIIINSNDDTVTVTFNDGFLVDREGSSVPVATSFTTTHTFTKTRVPIIDESFTGSISSNAHQSGLIKYVADPLNTENSAASLINGGLYYENSESLPLGLAQDYYGFEGSQISFVLWFKIDSEGQKTIFRKRGEGEDYSNYFLRVNNDKEIIVANGPSTDSCAYLHTGVYTAVGAWNFVAVTIDINGIGDGDKTVFINGQSLGTCRFYDSWAATSGNLFVGESADVTLARLSVARYIYTTDEINVFYQQYASTSISMTTVDSNHYNLVFSAPVTFIDATKFTLTGDYSFFTLGDLDQTNNLIPLTINWDEAINPTYLAITLICEVGFGYSDSTKTSFFTTKLQNAQGNPEAVVSSTYASSNTQAINTLTITFSHQPSIYYSLEVVGANIISQTFQDKKQIISLNTIVAGSVIVNFSGAKDNLSRDFPELSAALTIVDPSYQVINVFSPKNGATGVIIQESSVISLTFSQTITLAADKVITLASSTETYSVNTNDCTANDKILTIPLSSLISINYSSEIIKVTFGNDVINDFSGIVENMYSFTLSSPITPLSYILTPSANEVEASTTFEITFSKDITYNDGEIVFENAENNIYFSFTPSSSTLHMYKKKVAFSIPGGIPAGHVFTLTVPTTFVVASDSTYLAQPITSTFSTSNVVVPTCNWISSVTGESVATSNILYSVQCSKYITNIDFEKITATNAAVTVIPNDSTSFYVALAITLTDDTTPVAVTITAAEGYAVDMDATPNSVAAFTATFQVTGYVRNYAMNQNGQDSTTHGPTCLFLPNHFVLGPQQTETNAYEFSASTPSWYCETSNDDTFLGLPGTGYTFAFWYINYDNSASNTLISKSGTLRNYAVAVEENQLRIYLGTSYVSISAPSASSWHHVVVVFTASAEGVVPTLYVDGIETLFTDTLTASLNVLDSAFTIGSANSLLVSDYRAYAYSFTAAQALTLYSSLSIPSVTISIPSSIVSSNANAVVSVVFNKPITGFACSMFSVTPASSITWADTVGSEREYTCTGRVVATSGIISLYIPENVVVDTNNKGNRDSNSLSISVRAPVSVIPPFAYTRASQPISDPSFVFYIDYSFADVENVAVSDFTAEYGTLSSASISNNVYTATFTLNVNEDISSQAVITFNRNVCGETSTSACVFSFAFAPFFYSETVSKQVGDKYNDIYYQQLRFNAGSDWTISFETQCSGDAIVAIRPYPISSEDSFTTEVFGGGGNTVTSVRVTTDSTPTVSQQQVSRSPCEGLNTWASLWVTKSDTTISIGKGSTTYTSLNKSEFSFSGDMILVLSNWNNVVRYRNIRITTPSQTSGILPFIPYLTLDKSTTPYSGSITFSNTPQNDLTESGLTTTSVAISEFTKVSSSLYTFKASYTTVPVSSVKELYRYEVSVNAGAVTQEGTTTTNVKSSIYDYTTTPISIQASITWDSTTGPSTIPIPVTISFNTNYHPDISSILLPQGGSIIELSSTPNSVIIGVVPSSNGQATVAIPEGLVVDGDMKSNAASLDIYIEQPTNMIFYHGGSSYAYWPSTWRGFEHGNVGAIFSGSSTGGIRLGFSSIPGQVIGLIEVNLGIESGLLSNIREYTASGFRTVTSIKHTTPFVSSQARNYWVTCSSTTVAVGSGSIISSDSKVFEYDFGTTRNCLYFTFASINSGISIRNIHRIPYDDGDTSFKPITLQKSFSSSVTNTIPLIINASFEDRTIELSSWIVSNGYMSYGSKDNEFYLYPDGNDAVTYAYLPARIVNEPNLISMASDLIQLQLADYIDSYYLPPIMNGVKAPVWNSVFVASSSNKINLQFHMNVVSGTNGYLNVMLAESASKYANEHYELNICGVPSIKYVTSESTVDVATGTSYVCSSESTHTFNLNVDASSISVSLTDGTVLVSSTEPQAFLIKAYSFSANPNVLDKYADAVVKLSHLGINPPDVNVLFEDDFSTQKSNWYYDTSAGDVSGYSYAYTTLNDDGVLKLESTVANNPNWDSNTHKTVPYYAYNLPSEWTEVYTKARYTDNEIGLQLCIGLGRTSDLTMTADGFCIQNWNDNTSGIPSIGYQRASSSSGISSFVDFNGDPYQWVEMKITKSAAGYTLSYRQTETNINNWVDAVVLTTANAPFTSEVDRIALFLFNKNTNVKTGYYTDFRVTSNGEPDTNLLGCYTPFTYVTPATIITSMTNTPYECQATCQENYKFYALYQGDKCICIPEYSYVDTVRISSGSCSTVCAGDSTNYCGGQAAIAFYSVNSKFIFSTGFTASSGWKADIPDSTRGSYSFVDNTAIVNTLGLTDVTSSTRNSAPAIWLSAPASFMITVLVDIRNSPGTQVAGFALYNGLTENFKGVCALDWWSTTGPLIVYKMYGKTGNYEYQSMDITKRYWLRYTRDSNGILTCKYRAEDSLVWSKDFVDNTASSEAGYRIGLFGKSSTSPRTNVFSSFTFTNDLNAPTATFTHSIASQTAVREHTIRVSFSEAVILTGAYDLTNCEVISTTSVSNSIYDIVIRVVAEGAFSFNLNSSSAEDAAGNTIIVPEPVSATYSSSAISVVLSTEKTFINTPRFTVTVTFGFAVTGFEQSSILVNNANIISLNQLSATRFSLVCEAQSTGSVSVFIPSGAASNESGIMTSESNILVLTYDNNQLTVTLSSSKPFAQSYPIYVTAYFSKAIDESSIDRSKIQLGSGSVGAIKKITDTIYELEVQEN